MVFRSMVDITLVGEIPPEVEFLEPEAPFTLTIPDSGALEHLTIRPSDARTTANLRSRIETLRIVGSGEMKLAGETSIASLVLDAASEGHIMLETEAPLEVSRLELAGAISVHRTPSVEAEIVADDVASDEATLGTKTQQKLWVTAANLTGSKIAVGEGVVLTVAATTTTRLGLDRGSVKFEATEDAPVIKQPVVSGPGSVVIAGPTRVEHPTLSGILKLSVQADAAVWDVGGEVVSLHAAGTVKGSRSAGLRVQNLPVVSGARLENISLFALRSPSGLDTLMEADSLSVWMPSSYGKARKAQASMELDERETADFWQHAVRVMEQKTAEANALSKARYLRALARLRVIPTRDREWWVLFLYRSVSFGERVLTPALLYLILGLIASLRLHYGFDGAFMTDEGPAMLSLCGTLGHVLISPATFFRISGDIATPSGLGPVSILMAFRVVGVVLLFFILSTVRHLAAGVAPTERS